MRFRSNWNLDCAEEERETGVFGEKTSWSKQENNQQTCQHIYLFLTVLFLFIKLKKILGIYTYVIKITSMCKDCTERKLLEDIHSV